MTRAARVEGAPTVPSRWLLRLDTVLRAAGLEGRLADHAALGWQQRLDAPAARIRPTRAGAAAAGRGAAPPTGGDGDRDLDARSLRRLCQANPATTGPRPDRCRSRRRRSRPLHPCRARRVLARIAPACCPRTPRRGFIALGARAIRCRAGAAGGARLLVAALLAHRPLVRGPRARRGARISPRSAASAPSRLVLAAPAGAFTLTAKADRIDRLRAGGLAIIDYKTGEPAGAGRCREGLLAAAPARSGDRRGGWLLRPCGGARGGARILARRAGATGRRSEPTRRRRSDAALPSIAEARAGLARLMAHFDQPAHALPCPAPAGESAPLLRGTRISRGSRNGRRARGE